MTWLSANLAPLLNSVGLVLDIGGAWLVANEVVNQFRGSRYTRNEGWGSGNYVHVPPPQETGQYMVHEETKYSRMKLGLGFLTVGFALQIVSNWVR